MRSARSHLPPAAALLLSGLLLTACGGDTSGSGDGKGADAGDAGSLCGQVVVDGLNAVLAEQGLSSPAFELGGLWDDGEGCTFELADARSLEFGRVVDDDPIPAEELSVDGFTCYWDGAMDSDSQSNCAVPEGRIYLDLTYYSDEWVGNSNRLRPDQARALHQGFWNVIAPLYAQGAVFTDARAEAAAASQAAEDAVEADTFGIDRDANGCPSQAEVASYTLGSVADPQGDPGVLCVYQGDLMTLYVQELDDVTDDEGASSAWVAMVPEPILEEWPNGGAGSKYIFGADVDQETGYGVTYLASTGKLVAIAMVSEVWDDQLLDGSDGLLDYLARAE